MKKLISITLTFLLVSFNAYADVNIGARLKNGLQIDDVAGFQTDDGSRLIRRVYNETADGLELYGLMISKENEMGSQPRYSMQASLLLDIGNKIVADGVTGYLATIYGSRPTCLNTIIMVSVSENKVIISAESTDKNDEVIDYCIETEDLIGQFSIR